MLVGVRFHLEEPNAVRIAEKLLVLGSICIFFKKQKNKKQTTFINADSCAAVNHKPTESV